MSSTFPIAAESNVLTNVARIWQARSDLSLYVLMISIVAVAQVALFYEPELGAYLTTAAVALLLGVAVRFRRVRGLAFSVAGIPLFGMIGLSFIQQSAFEQTAVLYSSMFVFSLAYRYTLAPRTQALDSHIGIRSYFTVFPLAVVGGLLLGLMSYVLLVNSYIFGDVSLAAITALAVLGAFAEESLFRGLIQRQAMAVMKPRYAVILTCILYMTVSLSHFTVGSLAVGAISSVTLSIVYTIKPNLILTTTLNLASKLAYVWLVAAFLLH